MVLKTGARQDDITPYTPQENGMCERLIRTVKEECVWQHRFKDLEEARTVIRGWIEWYNTKRPHSALDYQTPSDYASKCRGSTSVAAQQAGHIQALAKPFATEGLLSVCHQIYPKPPPSPSRRITRVCDATAMARGAPPREPQPSRGE
jgi:hypothetical protein